MLAPQAAGPVSPDQLRDFNIQGDDIDGVLNALEELTGRTMIRPQALPPGTYTLKVYQMRVGDIITALETSLEKNGVAIIPLGDKFLEAVPLATARSEAPQVIEGSTLDLPPSGRIASKLFQLSYLRVNELFNQQMVTSMFSPGLGGSVIPVEKANAAFVTDTIANLQRLERLIDELDRPAVSGLTLKFYPLLNGAKASNVVNQLHSVFSGQAQNLLGTATTFNADDRTNQVIVLCDPKQTPMFDELISHLDTKADPNTRNEVIYLKYSDAKNVAQILQTLVEGQNSVAQRTAQTSVRPGEAPGPAFGSANIGGGNIGAPPPQAQAPAAQPNALPAGLTIPAGIASQVNAGEFSSLVTIAPDEWSNSVVVSGTADDIRLMRDVIGKIDVALAQVEIDCIIAEVDLSDTDTSGISALNLTTGTSAGHGTTIQQFAGSVAGWDVTSGVVNPLAFTAAFNPTSAGQASKVRILSEPVIMAAHNHQGEVSVGEQYPIITGTTSSPSSATGLSTSSTVSYEKIDIDLKVTPLIGDNGEVQMTVDQTVDDIEGYTTIDSNQQPIIGNREATSYVTVEDGQMIVLGGLQKTQRTATQNKIGLLYEIPFLTQLLGGHTDDLERTELLLFLRPHVISYHNSTPDTVRKINELSNKGDVNKFLTNPGDQPNSKALNMLDRFKN
jgi:general secretion pathway protein D